MVRAFQDLGLPVAELQHARSANDQQQTAAPQKIEVQALAWIPAAIRCPWPMNGIPAVQMLVNLVHSATCLDCGAVSRHWFREAQRPLLRVNPDSVLARATNPKARRSLEFFKIHLEGGNLPSFFSNRHTRNYPIERLR